MRKISAMYQWSGGTDYCHVCKECKNCISIVCGRKKRYKCKIYGITASSATDWKAQEIACKFFDRNYSGITLIETGISRKRDRKNRGNRRTDQSL